jgi:hypothetical protein
MTSPGHASTASSAAETAPAGRRAVRAAIWLPGLAVALGAAVATAHGLFEVALAARVPVGIAWLYPLITDGLALVAYAATARLHGSAGRYAWSVVVLAAGLSGLAQAAYLASATTTLEAPPGLRFGVGAWPAIAAAIVAHLLYLLLDTDKPAAQPVRSPIAVQPPVFSRTTVQPGPGSNPMAETTSGVQRPGAVEPRVESPALLAATDEQQPARPVESPARDRARTAASRHAAHHGALPSVTDLEALAQVSRGTAAAVLKHLRQHPAPLHLITSTDQNNPEERSQP